MPAPTFAMSEYRVAAATCLLLVSVGCKPSASTSTGNTRITKASQSHTLHFTEVTGDSGVKFVYQNAREANHSAILESLGGGVSLLDFDRDGLLDICLPGGGTLTSDEQIGGVQTGFFRNLGSLRFEETKNCRLSPCQFFSFGAASGDYNNDGFSDVLITGYGGVELWTNQGDGTFIESAKAASIESASWNTSAAWGDLNGDGSLDLYLEHYVNWSFSNHPFCSTPDGRREICSPKDFEPLPDQIYFGNGDGTFRDATQHAGLRSDGKGLGVLLLDADDDDDLDIYVANDTVDNFLYLNGGHGQFEEIGMLRGVAVDDRGIANGSMGVDALDYNGDGRLDIWVANYEDETFALYRNDGEGYFYFVSDPAGVTSLGQYYVGFGTAAADFDHDGDEDLLVANGHAIKYPRRSSRSQQPVFLRNDKGRFLRAESIGAYFGASHEGRGLAIGDLDNDGDLDFLVSHVADPVGVLRNDQDSGDWFGVQLTGIKSNRDAIGAKLTLKTTKGDMVRQIKGGGSYLSTNDPRVFWGLPGDAKVEQLVIRWPDGGVQTIAKPAQRQLHRVVEKLESTTINPMIPNDGSEAGG
ncbi:MAG: CRTAC1 family protein [Planctomycetaceae bacterium]|nr:CRTAC1 family protein [Planctomycetales bacterium]MCB9924819.1 CRTAC1 family protein [Planctomycetaceae bacterium]